LGRTPNDLFLQKIKNECGSVPVHISEISQSMGVRFPFLILERLAKIENHGIEIVVCLGKKTWIMEAKNEKKQQ